MKTKINSNEGSLFQTMNADESKFCTWKAQVQSITLERGKSVEVCGWRAPDSTPATWNVNELSLM